MYERDNHDSDKNKELDDKKIEYEQELNDRHKARVMGLTVSMGSGWQKQSSGRTHNSASSHNFLVGCHSGKVLGLVAFFKKM
jgi:hypothetical protein